MKFWFLNPWDALPGEMGFDRGSQVVRALADAGHEVIWWQTGFAHADKSPRTRRLEIRKTGIRETLILLPAREYQSNVSARRLFSIADYVWGFMRESRRHPKPDAILISGPIFFSEPALLYFRWIRGIPLVFEFRDLWPETIINSANGYRRIVRWAVFGPFFLLRRAVLRSSAGVLGLNRTYLNIALKEAGGRRKLESGVAYPSPVIVLTETRSVMRKPSGEIWAISSGTLGASHDHTTLLSAAARLKSNYPNLRFFITGSGVFSAEIKQMISDLQLTNVEFLGALKIEEFRAFLMECDVGLALYRSFSPVVFPTKIVDYMMAGLAIITSARGEGAEILSRAECGAAIAPEDVDALVRILGDWATEPSQMADLKTNSRKLGEYFRSDAQIKVIVDILSRVGARSGVA